MGVRRNNLSSGAAPGLKLPGANPKQPDSNATLESVDHKDLPYCMIPAPASLAIAAIPAPVSFMPLKAAFPV